MTDTVDLVEQLAEAARGAVLTRVARSKPAPNDCTGSWWRSS